MAEDRGRGGNEISGKVEAEGRDLGFEERARV